MNLKTSVPCAHTVDYVQHFSEKIFQYFSVQSSAKNTKLITIFMIHLKQSASCAV